MYYYARVENATKVLQNFTNIIIDNQDDLMNRKINIKDGIIYMTNLTGTKDIRNRMNIFADHANLIRSVLGNVQSNLTVLYTGHHLYVNRDEIELYNKKTKYFTGKYHHHHLPAALIHCWI